MAGPGRPSAYTVEFREEAVRLARSPGHTVSGVARDLGVKPETLRSWITRSGVSAEHPLEPGERRELVELRRRVKTLELEREILKKAAAFFAQETERTR
jgi:transposase-like protein